MATVNTLPLGQMRYDISIQAKTVIKDDFGAETITWTTLHGLKAGVKFLSGLKLINDEEFFTEEKLIFQIHYRSDIDETCIVLFNTFKYRINFIEPIGFRQGLELICSKINE
jgi:SPP1 family predicted phage head-tail adaptor